MPPASFRKSERLTHRTTIDSLFEKGLSVVPKGAQRPTLRIKYFLREGAPPEGTSPVQVLFAVPKRRFKRATARAKLRRQLREVYRLHKQPLVDACSEKQCHLQVAVLVTAHQAPVFTVLETQLVEALAQLEDRVRTLQLQVDANEAGEN